MAKKKKKENDIHSSIIIPAERASFRRLVKKKKKKNRFRFKVIFDSSRFPSFLFLPISFLFQTERLGVVFNRFSPACLYPRGRDLKRRAVLLLLKSCCMADVDSTNSPSGQLKPAKPLLLFPRPSVNIVCRLCRGCSI